MAKKRTSKKRSTGSGGILRSGQLKRLWKLNRKASGEKPSWPALKPTAADLIQKRREDEARLLGYLGEERYKDGPFTPEDRGDIQVLSIGKFKQ